MSIKLVQGDTLPNITLTLTDPNTGDPINLSDPEVSVEVHFRKSGSTTLLSTIQCDKVTDGSDGQVRFNFSGGVLDVPAGQYEGEVQVNFEGAIKTVYTVLKFIVRGQFD